MGVISVRLNNDEDKILKQLSDTTMLSGITALVGLGRLKGQLCFGQFRATLRNFR